MPPAMSSTTYIWKTIRSPLSLGQNRLAGGFTLIEVLVVLAVVGVLLSLLIPILNNARSSARTVQGLSNQRQIGSGIGSFTIDHDESFPLGFDDSGPYSTWASLISPYFHTNQKASFPDFLTLISSPLNEVFLDPNVTYKDNPANPELKRNLDYSGHLYLLGSTTSGVTPPYQVFQVKRSSEMMLVTDGTQYLKPPPVPALYVSATANNIDVGGIPFYNPSSTDIDNAILPGPNEDGDDSDVLGYIRWRQFNDTAANFLFVDGHAATNQMAGIKYRNVRVDLR